MTETAPAVRRAESAEAVARLVEPSVEALGFRLVRARLLGGGPRTLEILAERLDGSMTVDDCATLSEAISAILDVTDPIGGEYLLEVSSPGLDRPLTRPDDYQRFNGSMAKLHLRRAIEGRRRMQGRLRGVADGHVHLEADGGVISIDFADIESAHLVITGEIFSGRPS